MTTLLPFLLLCLTLTPGWAGEPPFSGGGGTPEPGKHGFGGAGGGSDRAVPLPNYPETLKLTTCSAGDGGGMDHIQRSVGIENKKIAGTPSQCTTETIHLPPDPCLAQMREAMKAMEVYLLAIIEVKDVDDFQKASKLWNAAKRDCFKETP